jgi:HTH-type transcriptional regulator / antitoxin HigA
MTADAFSPDWFSKPSDTLTAMMAKRGVSLSALADALDGDARLARSIVSGVDGIDDRSAAAISALVGGSVAFWRKRQEGYERSLSRALEAIPSDDAQAWLKELPIRHMAEHGWIENSREFKARLQTCMMYFGVNGPDEWYWRYTNTRKYNFRTSSTFTSSEGALAAWLRQGEIKAAATPTADWSVEKLREAFPIIRRLSWTRSPGLFVPKLRSLLAEAGVALVFARAPTGCKASGAARFISKRKALVQLSFRYRADDHVWFTLLHELAHLVLHGSEQGFVDGDEMSEDRMESEANEFAQKIAIPERYQEELFDLRPRTGAVIEFGKKVGIAPGIIVGQLQHLKILGPDQLNPLKRRYEWDEVEAAFA